MDRDQQPSPLFAIDNHLSASDLYAAEALADAVERSWAAEQDESGQYIRMSADHIPRLTRQAEMEQFMQQRGQFAYIKQDGGYDIAARPQYAPYFWTVDLLLLDVTIINRRRAP